MMVSTGEVTNIQTNSAEASGMVIDLGEGATQHGHCYGTLPNVTIAGTKTQQGTPPTGGFTSQLTNLTAGTKYYIKAYISDGSETVYGKEISFTTVAATIPVVTTSAVTSVTTLTAVSGGDITSDGGASVTAKGICWSTSTGPTTEGSKTSDGTGTGVFTSSLTGLSPNTTYFIRAYAINTSGTGYGDELSFKTIAAAPPVLSTAEITDITQNTATSGGNITSDGGVQVTIRGVCWNTSGSPTTADSKTEDGEVTGSFVSSLTGLTGNTTYYVRSYATNSAGTSYGDEKSFKTGAVLSTVTTTVITSVTSTGAVSGGDITDDGGSPVTARGVCWNTGGSPTTADSKTSNGSGTGSFASNLAGLTANTTYYVRAYVTTSVGTAYGGELSFTTSTVSIGLPTISTTAITAITSTTASSGGNITGNGGSTVSISGVCWSTSSNPTIIDNNTVDGTNTGSFTSSITGLNPGTVYHVRAYATNSVGTAYGSELSFTTNAAAISPPTAAAAAATSVANTSATLNGAVNANGNDATVTFEYGFTDLYGSEIAAIPSPVTGSTTVSVSANLAGLTVGTLYHYRVKAVNAGGTTYSVDNTLTTLQIPDAITEAATTVTITDATLNATVNANNLSTTVTFEYGITIGYGNTVTAVPNPVTGLAPTDVSYGLSSLDPGTTYHFRIKAVNTGGTTYGEDKTFTTLCTSPSATTDAATQTDVNSTTLNGTVNANGFSTAVTFEYGTSTSYGTEVVALTSPVTGNVNSAVSANIGGLTSNTLYHYRVKTINCGGTTFGSDMTFITKASVTTTPISNITATTASSGGTIAVGGGESITTRGVCWSTITNPTIADSKTIDGSGTGSFISSISELTSNSVYYVRAYVTNDGGTSYGEQESFTTLATIATTAISNITASFASSGGTIDFGGGASILERGICWSTTINPTINDYITTSGAGTGSFSSDIPGLSFFTTYFVRAYATNISGIVYGNEISFKTLCEGTYTVNHTSGTVAPVTKTVTYGLQEINNQCWITQNLGADNQASSATDNSETAAGWYWQFNRKQGYKHDGTTRTPATAWPSIDEFSDWVSENDPCNILLGTGWRIPTIYEWIWVSNPWENYNDAYNSVLKMHAAGGLGGGDLILRGSEGHFWSNYQISTTAAQNLECSSIECYCPVTSKAMGTPLRCLKD